jgi:hypothetical protein
MTASKLLKTPLPHFLSHGSFIKRKHKIESGNKKLTTIKLPEYDILNASSVVLQAQNAPKLLVAGALSGTPLRELTTFPQIPPRGRLDSRVTNSQAIDLGVKGASIWLRLLFRPDDPLRREAGRREP